MTLPDLTGSGYRLMGGRLIATSPRSRCDVACIDDDRGNRLVVLTRPMISDQSAPMAPHSGGDVSGFSWADGGMGYSLVGQAAADTSSRSPTKSAGRRARSRISTAGYRLTKTVVPTIKVAAMNSSTAGRPKSVATTPVVDCISARAEEEREIDRRQRLAGVLRVHQLPRHAVQQWLRRHGDADQDEQRAVDLGGTAVTPSSSDSG